MRGFLRGNAIKKSAIVAAAARTRTYRHGAAVIDAVLRTALAPWCPRDHAVWPASFRTMVVPVLCACRARNLPMGVALAHVLPCCGRDWWRRHGPDGGKPVEDLCVGVADAAMAVAAVALVVAMFTSFYCFPVG